jgi:hypothetical protein
MCVKKTAFICAALTPVCASRMTVPRPASNCITTALQLLLSSPYRTSVPAPARSLKGAGVPVPVSVTLMQGAACAVGTVTRTTIATREATIFAIDLITNTSLEIFLHCLCCPMSMHGASG